MSDIRAGVTLDEFLTEIEYDDPRYSYKVFNSGVFYALVKLREENMVCVWCGCTAPNDTIAIHPLRPTDTVCGEDHFDKWIHLYCKIEGK